jgi:hypothetical protein
VAKVWIKAFVKEIQGILITRRACEIADPGPDDDVVPIMELFKCKLDKDGLIDKVKCRCVFRGDLYDPKDPQDSWNPHASFLALKVFLAICAKMGIFPMQVDFLLAYLQANMRERVFVQFPEPWKQYLPEHLWKYIGRPLLLKKALYGYNYSGKFLYQDQADFLREHGMQESGLPGLWFRRGNDGSLLLFLHYSDDILVAGTSDRELRAFIDALGKRFDIEAKPRADWYLQTRIQQDASKNITLDQSRYSKAMVSRFLPNYSQEPTKEEMDKYDSPVKTTTVFTKNDCSKDREEVTALEEEYGFRYIELSGCFNWLAYTCFEEIYAIRKLCKYMNLPGRRHFQAALHLLHHFRCHPPRPLVFYHDIQDAPVTRLLSSIEGFDGDPTFVVFADSAHADCDKGRSTACDIQVFQGGLIDHISWTPNPIPLSTAESESMCYSAAIARSRFSWKGIATILFGDPNYDYTIPIIVDSSAAIAMNNSDKPTKRTRHIESRYWYGSLVISQGGAKLYKARGEDQQPADMGTKSKQSKDTEYYRSLFESNYCF